MIAAEASVEQNVTDWDALCEVGRLAAQQIDEGRWIVGDTALLVETHYGEDWIAEYARECNLAKKRVQEYRTVCSFYEKSARADFLQDNPNITYSHLRAAMRMNDPEIAYMMLDVAAHNNWTVDQFGMEISKNLGNSTNKPLFNDSGPLSDVLARVASALGATERQVRIVIYEVTP